MKRIAPKAENSTDDEDDDTVPGLQNRDNSSSDDDSEYNWGDDDLGIKASRNDEGYLFNESDNRKNRYQYVLTSTNSISTTEWFNNYNNYDKYDGDNDEEEDEMSRLTTKHPTAPLWLRGGNIILQVETVTEENSKEVVDTDDTVIVEDEKKKRRKRKKRAARQTRS